VRENVTSEVTVQNVKKRKNRSEIERDSRERSRIRASLDGVNNKDNEPATSTSAQPPPLHLSVIIYNILILTNSRLDIIFSIEIL
jgi:hypothetical protein